MKLCCEVGKISNTILSLLFSSLAAAAAVPVIYQRARPVPAAARLLRLIITNKQHQTSTETRRQSSRETNVLAVWRRFDLSQLFALFRYLS